jgi:lysophospholipase L1-like esterase
MPSYSHIVALGSSFAAGPGLGPYESRAAMRSRRNYAHLLADSFGAKLTDLTVSGATTSTLLDVSQRVLMTTFAPQVKGIAVDADVITITAGGNDLNYIASIGKAAVHGWLHRRVPLPSPVSDEAIEKAIDGLTRVAEAARHTAPAARILLVDYLTVLGEQTTLGPQAPFGPEILTALHCAAPPTSSSLSSLLLHSARVPSSSRCRH